MRLYNQQELINLRKQPDGKEELERKLAMVRSSDELTDKEKHLNIEMLEYALTGKKYTKQQVLDDIDAGMADMNDIVGGIQ